MKKSRMLMMSLLFAPLLASAHNFQLLQRVAPVSVTDRGELHYANGDFSYEKWSSGKLSGKVRVIQHIAGRSSAKDMNDPLIEAIKAAKLPRDRYQTTTIINIDDAIVGTGMFVRSSIEDNKKEFPWSQFIVDNKGYVKKAWDLQSNGSAIIVLDDQGRVKFAKDGKLTEEEVQQVMNMLHQMLR
ncbi:YtfJ family protein [Serratia rhizosphaerae]|uniref:YtfJ family protein n=1 Tax=Serratia rhizosphaerae TaxID=2597702 RepID=A0ABX6GKZ2_9GAMM|nr:YtfJ family protein [Serratia rhizosphaerae]MEB6337157.1 YtfJ family protein [Serratia rhizosphaerae]QHA86926.1 YtfJ family protein [Serratia rhizosphaerae]